MLGAPGTGTGCRDGLLALYTLVWTCFLLAAPQERQQALRPWPWYPQKTLPSSPASAATSGAGAFPQERELIPLLR